VTADGGLVGHMDAKSAGATVTDPTASSSPTPVDMSALGMCLRIFATHNPDDPFLDLGEAKIIQTFRPSRRTRVDRLLLLVLRQPRAEPA
jgi:hypothetical protein